MKSSQKLSMVLDCFSAAEPRLSVQTVADRTGLPKTTAHRMLKSLKDIGLVVQDGNRDAYRLGLRLLSLGGVVLSDLDIPRHANGPAARLMQQSGETVHICVFDGQNVVSIDRHEMTGASNEVIRLEREPPYCTSTGKAILATLPEETARALIGDGLEPYSRNTITDWAVLKSDLATTRSRGYAIDDEERQPGIRCVGAAIRHRKNVVGAISVTGSKARFSRSRIRVLADFVMAAAATISLSIEKG